MNAGNVGPHPAVRIVGAALDPPAPRASRPPHLAKPGPAPRRNNAAAWKRHCDGIVASIEPVGGLEEFLAQRLASLLWRLNRVVRYEVAATMLSVEGTAEALLASAMYLAGTNLAEGGIILPEPEIVEEQRELRILSPDHHLDRITRQERHFHRQALQTLHEIEALQTRRKGHRVNLARVDFSGPSAT